MSRADRLFDLTDRVVVVTGASSGLGRHCAELFADAGAIVIAAARRLDALEQLGQSSDSIHPLRCDVTDDDDRRRLVETTIERFGQIDVLLNNAGVAGASPAEEESLENFERILGVNLTAAFAMSQLVGTQMLARGRGSIVNVASMFGLLGSLPIRQVSYVVSKAGVVNMTRQLGAEWASRGVRVNAIAPGFFSSEMTVRLYENETWLAAVEERTPIGRTASMEELDGCLLLLASDAGSYIVGQTIPVDGGWSAV